MILPDVNVLIYAFRMDLPRHTDYREWLARTLESQEAYGVSELVLSSLLRIATNPRAFPEPNTLGEAMDFVDAIRGQPNCVLVAPGPRHWSIFQDLCWKVEAKGNLVPDAYLAALAIESGCQWITTDRDYARFPGLRWRHPLE